MLLYNLLIVNNFTFQHDFGHLSMVFFARGNRIISNFK